ncbi:MAG: hypothetical protein P8J59_10845 [Phycisphaerales bacterium]|jgi:hypothetical protein|nr:hypothetical protein [Phycisphaerales bacterium]
MKKHEEFEPDSTSVGSSDPGSVLDPALSPVAWMREFAAGFMTTDGGSPDGEKSKAEDGEAIVASWIERGRAGLDPIERRLSEFMAESSRAAIAASEARIMERLDRIESRLSSLESKD